MQLFQAFFFSSPLTTLLPRMSYRICFRQRIKLGPLLLHLFPLLLLHPRFVADSASASRLARGVNGADAIAAIAAIDDDDDERTANWSGGVKDGAVFVFLFAAAPAVVTSTTVVGTEVG